MSTPLRFRGPQVQVLLVGAGFCAVIMGVVLRAAVADAYDPVWARGGVVAYCFALAGASRMGVPARHLATGLRVVAVLATLWTGLLLWGNHFPPGASSGVIVVQALCMVLFPSTREALLFTALMAATVLAAGSITTAPVASPLALAASVVAVGVIFVFTTHHRAVLDRRLRRANDELEQKVLERTEALEREVDERRAAEARALEASESKSRFVANMSHELRTPLNAILGYTELVGEEVEDGLAPAEIQQDLDKVAKAANHLLSLVNDVLDLSRIEAGVLELFVESVDVEAIVHDAVAEVGPMAAQNRNRLVVEVVGLGTLSTDRQRLRQILLNLLSNAAKFTQDGTITVHGSVEAGRVSLTVSDTGVGIEPAALKALFQRFVQVDDSPTRRVGGTGLGLALSRDLARQMGGDVTATSTPGVGSAFTVWLPRS